MSGKRRRISANGTVITSAGRARPPGLATVTVIFSAANAEAASDSEDTRAQKEETQKGTRASLMGRGYIKNRAPTVTARAESSTRRREGRPAWAPAPRRPA